MKEQKPKHSHEATGTYKNKEVIIVGEVYDEPIKTTQSAEMYSKLDIIIDGVVVRTHYDTKMIAEEKNKELVEQIASNIEKILE